MALASGSHERIRRIDGCDVLRGETPDELGGERARTAADVEYPLAAGDICQVCKPWSEWRGDSGP